MGHPYLFTGGVLSKAAAAFGELCKVGSLLDHSIHCYCSGPIPRASGRSTQLAVYASARTTVRHEPSFADYFRAAAANSTARPGTAYQQILGSQRVRHCSMMPSTQKPVHNSYRFSPCSALRVSRSSESG